MTSFFFCRITRMLWFAFLQPVAIFFKTLTVYGLTTDSDRVRREEKKNKQQEQKQLNDA